MATKRSQIKAAVAGLVALPLVAAGGWLLYSKLGIDHNVPLPDAIPDTNLIFLQNDKTGRLSCYYDRLGSKRPLLFIHSVNAAASAYEVEPLFQHYRADHPVFALDLPGFGASNRSEWRYTPQLMETAVIAALEEINQPADIIALSLGGEFAARAIVKRPELAHSVTIISPTGLGQRPTGGSKLLHMLLAFPLWGQALFDLIASRRSIRYFLQKSFIGAISPGFVDFAYATAHQPDAHHAPLTFISGLLFTPQVRIRVYEKMTVPTLAIYDRDAYTNFENLPHLLAQNSYWQAERLSPSAGLPHFERLEETTAVIDKFWANISG